MTKITILDTHLENQLAHVSQPVELCTASGQTLGRFVPEIDPAKYEPREPQVSEEELDRREQSDEWYSTEEVLAHLEKLP